MKGTSGYGAKDAPNPTYGTGLMEKRAPAGVPLYTAHA